MKKRQYDFLKLLLDQISYVPVSFYARQMQVSEKTLRRDIPFMNTRLKPYGASIKSKTGKGIQLDLTKADMEKILSLVSVYQEKRDTSSAAAWEKNSRRMDIALNLLLYSDEVTSLSDLAYKYYVSKSSITNDIKALKDFFKSHCLALLQSKEGTGLAGEEADIRSALIDIMIFILDSSLNRTDRGAQAGLDLTMMSTILDCFSESDLNTVEGSLRAMEETVNYYFDEKEYSLISITLLVFLYRIRSGFPIHQQGVREKAPDTARADHPFYLQIRDLGRQLGEQCGVVPSLDEFNYLYEALSDTHLFYCYLPHDTGDDQETANAFGSDFIDAFSVITEINIREESSLYLNIMSHITLMLNRVKMNASARNPIISQILKEYQGLINVCQIICWILAKKFHLAEISIDEICYLTLYIQGEIMEKEEKARILLVSNLQKGVVSLIRHKLMTMHSKWDITTCSYYNYFELHQTQYDFAVSTLILDEKRQEIPYVHISPMLDAKDMKRIDTMFQYTKYAPDTYLHKLVSLMNDLRDIGCSILILSEDMEWIPEAESLKLMGQKTIQYIYSLNHIQTNSCHFMINAREHTIEKVVLTMYSWDFMLFASKLVYLLNNCQDFVVSDFANILLEEK